MTRIRPTEVLMQQADLLQRIEPVGRFRDIVTSTVASMWGSTEAQAEIAPDGAVRALTNGQTYLVAEHMTDLVRAAADSLDDTDTMDVSMFPDRAGVICFESPYTFTDLRGSECKVHWMTWSLAQRPSTTAFGTPTTRRFVVVTLWNDLTDPDDVATALLDDMRDLPGLRKVLGRWNCVGALHISDGHVLGSPERDPSEDDLANAAYVTEESRRQRLSTPDVVPGAKVVSMPRVLWATVLLMSQEIVSTTRSTHTKSEAKVLRRNNAPESLTVVTLRRRSTSGTGGGTSLSVRSLTRGHWAWRRCGQSHPMAQEYENGYRARVWINPYLRGPQDAPIKTTKKVYRLSR